MLFMKFQNFMNKVRHWDNTIARWIMRHFYILFFQIVLVCIFFIWFINLFSVIDTSFQASSNNIIEKTLATQSINTTIIVFLLLLNSFWLLFIFSSIQGLKALLKDISYYTSRLRNRAKE